MTKSERGRRLSRRRVIGVLAMVGAAPSAMAKKRYRHALGFRAELPDGWTTEDAPVGVTLAPPGMKLDPEREDNPEVYTIWSARDDNSSEEEYIAGLRERFKRGNVAVDRGGDVAPFPVPRRQGGVVYTFDFVHPERKAPYRIRVFAVHSRGKPILLIAQGRREALEQRDRVLRQIAGTLEWDK